MLILLEIQEKHDIIKVGMKADGAMIDIEQAIPCIMHAKNRCGKKFIKEFLLAVLKEYDGLIKQDTILPAFTDFINTKILGNGKNHKSNWKLPSCPNGSSKGKKIYSRVPSWADFFSKQGW